MKWCELSLDGSKAEGGELFVQCSVLWESVLVAQVSGEADLDQFSMSESPKPWFLHLVLQDVESPKVHSPLSSFMLVGGCD